MFQHCRAFDPNRLKYEPVDAERGELLDLVDVERVLGVAGLDEVDADVGDLVVDGLEALAQLPAGLVRALAAEEDGDVLLVLLEGVDDLRGHLLDDVLFLYLKKETISHMLSLLVTVLVDDHECHYKRLSLYYLMSFRVSA